MKQQTRTAKLALRRDTLRILTRRELLEIEGGGEGTASVDKLCIAQAAAPAQTAH